MEPTIISQYICRCLDMVMVKVGLWNWRIIDLCGDGESFS